MVPSLEKGDLPILCEFEGELRKIGSVRYSALVLSDLVKVSPLEFCKDKDTVCTIKTSADVVEAML